MRISANAFGSSFRLSMSYLRGWADRLRAALPTEAVPGISVKSGALEVLVWEEETAKLVRQKAIMLGIPPEAVHIVRLLPYLWPYPSEPELGQDAHDQFLAEHIHTDAEGNQFALTGLPPIVGSAPRVLILGSMPGAISLRKNEYYASSTNRFWKIMEAVAGVRSELYQERTAQLADNGLALWDTLKHCSRVGSLDAAILKRSEIPNDLVGFLESHPSVSRIVFNGVRAADSFRRLVEPKLPDDLRTRVDRVTAPSTSAANAKVRLSDLVAVWREALLT